MRTSLLHSRENGAECFEMVSGCGRTERCYIQIRVDDGMRTWESRWVVVVFGPRRFFWSERIYGRFACTRRSNTEVETYGRRIVFKTAGGSQALKPSCDLVLPQRARVPSRSVSRRNFNTLVYLTNVRPLLLSPLFSSLPLPMHFRSCILVFFFCFFYFVFLLLLLIPRLSPAYSSDAFSSFVPMCSFFCWVSSGSPDIPRRELVRWSPFCISPLRKRRPGRHVVAVRLESRIYC